MLRVPQQRVDLSIFVDVKGMSDTEAEMIVQQHLSAVGMEQAPCQTVGCLAGWMVTMPDVQRMLAQQQQTETSNTFASLNEYIGFGFTMREGAGYTRFLSPFSARTEEEQRGKYKRMTDWEIACERCVSLIVYAEQRCQELEAQIVWEQTVDNVIRKEDVTHAAV